MKNAKIVKKVWNKFLNFLPQARLNPLHRATYGFHAAPGKNRRIPGFDSKSISPILHSSKEFR